MALHYGTGANEALAELVRIIRPVVESHGSPVQRAEFLEDMSLLSMRRGRYAVSDDVLHNQQIALTAWRETGDQGGIANNQCSLGFCHLWRRELEAAEREFQAALKLAVEIGHARVQIICMTYLTILQRFRGDIDGAQQLAQQSLTLAEQSGIQYYIGMAKANLAWAARRRGQLDAGETLCLEALALMPPAYPFRWAALWPLIGVAMERREFATAMNCVRQLLDPTQQRLSDEMTPALEATLTAWDGEEVGESDQQLHHAAEIAVELGYL